MRSVISLLVATTLCLSSSMPSTVMAAGVPLPQGDLEAVVRAGCAIEVAAVERQMRRDGKSPSRMAEEVTAGVALVDAATTAQLSEFASMAVEEDGDALLKCFAATILKSRAAPSIAAAAAPAPKPASAAVAADNLDAATACVTPLQPGPVGDGGLYGSMQNTCGFAVSVVYCIRNPAVNNSGTQAFNCDQKKTGLDTIPAGARRATHVGNTGDFLWMACRQPAVPQATYTAAQGFRG